MRERTTYIIACASNIIACANQGKESCQLQVHYKGASRANRQLFKHLRTCMARGNWDLPDGDEIKRALRQESPASGSSVGSGAGLDGEAAEEARLCSLPGSPAAISVGEVACLAESRGGRRLLPAACRGMPRSPAAFEAVYIWVALLV